jgi:hypothetical protein
MHSSTCKPAFQRNECDTFLHQAAEAASILLGIQPLPHLPATRKKRQDDEEAAARKKKQEVGSMV